MAVGTLAVIITLVVVLILSVLAIVVSTTRGATKVETWWSDGDDEAGRPHTRHARHFTPPADETD